MDLFLRRVSQPLAQLLGPIARIFRRVVPLPLARGRCPRALDLPHTLNSQRPTLNLSALVHLVHRACCAYTDCIARTQSHLPHTLNRQRPSTVSTQRILAVYRDIQNDRTNSVHGQHRECFCEFLPGPAAGVRPCAHSRGRRARGRHHVGTRGSWVRISWLQVALLPRGALRRGSG